MTDGPNGDDADDDEMTPGETTPDEAPNLEDSPGPRPIPVAVASLLLLMLAAAELLLSVLLTALNLNGYKAPLLASVGLVIMALVYHRAWFAAARPPAA